jgi:hypothetical protein
MRLWVIGYDGFEERFSIDPRMFSVSRNASLPGAPERYPFTAESS